MGDLVDSHNDAISSNYSYYNVGYLVISHGKANEQKDY
jgi:hypothetical protein